MAEANALALQDIEAANAAAPTTPPAEPAPATPTPETPAAPEPVPDEAPKVIEEVEIKVDGKAVRLPKEEALRYAQKGFDYTKKTQQVAEERKVLEAQKAKWEAEQVQLRAFLSDPAKVQEYLQELQRQTGFASTNPDEVLTASQMQQALQAQARQLALKAQEEIGKAVNEAKIDLETKRLEADYTDATTRSIREALKAHPVLSAVDDVDDLLKADAWKRIKLLRAEDSEYAPEKEDLTRFITEAAEKRAAKLSETIKNHEKTVAARAAKLTTQGIEPAGGAPPKTTGEPPRYKLGDKELRAAVIADLERPRSS